MKDHNYFVYILTNPGKSVLYVGMTNDLGVRLQQHYSSRGNRKHFATKYYCHKLLYYERFTYIWDAIEREKEIKKWKRSKKMDLIQSMNPNLKFLNGQV